MTPSGFDNYIKARYESQLQWYSRSATQNKTWHRRFQVAIAILSATVTVTVALGMSDGASAAWHVGSLTTSAVVTLLVSLQKTLRFHDNWVEYRTTAEDLKRERYYHEFICGDYATAESPDQLFVERVEELISQQNTRWKVGTVASRLQSGLDSNGKSTPEGHAD